MLTATPHNGKRESFASLMRMLDPTVLPEGADYTREDVAHLFVRRFKKDVREQMRQDFPEREVYKLAIAANAVEDLVFDCLSELALAGDVSKQHDGTMLFRTTLEKALFSSPAACLQTLKERLRKLENRDPAHPDIAALRELQSRVAAITPEHFSKYRHLVNQLQSGAHWQWNGKDPSDRLVIFTERIETLKFLREHLPNALGLKDSAVGILHGQLSDVDIQQTVEDFGKTHSPLRLLIASDVASEGLNLHYQSHRLLHFDIPWSLMVFQQRNGRVDRYGQTRVPRIGYLLTTPLNDSIRGDLRILEILIEKDEQAARNIGDPSAFMGLYDEVLETARVAEAMESNTTAEAFAAQLACGDVDPFEALWNAAGAGDISPDSGARAQTEVPTAPLPTLFNDDYGYTREALKWLRQQSPRDFASLQFDDAKRTLGLQPGADLAHLLDRELAPEMRPQDNTFALSADKTLVDAAIKNARDSGAWPQLHYLWPLHPIAHWLDFKLLALFGRQRAPVVRVQQGIAAGEAIVLVLAQVPNRRGQPVLTEWMGIGVNTTGNAHGVLTLTEVFERTALGAAQLANDDRTFATDAIQASLPAVIQLAESHLRTIKRAFDANCKQRCENELRKLQTLCDKHRAQLEIDFSRGIEQINAALKRQKQEATTDLFQTYQKWVRETLELDDRAQFTVVAALTA